MHKFSSRARGVNAYHHLRSLYRLQRRNITKRVSTHLPTRSRPWLCNRLQEGMGQVIVERMSLEWLSHHLTLWISITHKWGRVPRKHEQTSKCTKRSSLNYYTSSNLASVSRYKSIKALTIFCFTALAEWPKSNVPTQQKIIWWSKNTLILQLLQLIGVPVVPRANKWSTPDRTKTRFPTSPAFKNTTFPTHNQ